MDVRLEDGTIVRNVPEGITQQELLRRLGRAQGAPADPDAPPQAEPPIPDPIMIDPTTPQPPATAFDAFGRAALVRFLGNLGEIPENLLQALLPQQESPAGIPGPIDLTADLVRLATRGGLDPAAAGTEVAPQLEGAFSGENILGTSAAVGRTLTGRRTSIPEAQQAQQDVSARLAEERPVATAAGDIAGDIATVLTGRAGLRAGGAVPALQQAAPRVGQTAQTVLGRALKAFGKSTASTAKRALETGAEGAFLGALQGVDTSEAAATGAGAQVVGDVALKTFNTLRTNNRLLQAIALGTVVSLGIQQLTPGGLDRVLPTFEERNKEAILTLLLGGGAAAATGGRIPKTFAGPAFAEIVDVARRGTTLSLLNSWVRDPVRVGPIVQKFSEDPDFFGPRARDLLTRAINSEKIDIRNTVDRLMKDSQFRQRFETLER